MGAYGYNSYENDACMDEIDSCAEVPRGKIINRNLGRIFSPSMQFYSDDKRREIRLGCVIYYLDKRSHLVIPMEYLKEAMACACSLKNDIEYLARWNLPEERKIKLEREIEMLEIAQIDSDRMLWE